MDDTPQARAEDVLDALYSDSDLLIEFFVTIEKALFKTKVTKFGIEELAALMTLISGKVVELGAAVQGTRIAYRDEV